MTKHSCALALALAVTTTLYGCDQITNVTEQEHIQRAKGFEDRGNLKGSIIELKNAIQKNPDSPQARLLLGQVYLKVGMGAEAEKELTQAKKLGVSSETIKPHLGEALLLTGEYKRLLDEIQPSDQTSKANLGRILQLRADALLNLGRLKDACGLFQQSLEASNSNPPTYWGLAKCAVSERNLVQARQWLDDALKLSDRQVMTWNYIGDLENIQNNTDASVAAYAAALKLDPESLVSLGNRATVHMKLGRTELAKTDIEKIRKLAPNSLTANYLQALLKFKEGKNIEARDALQEVFKATPNYLPALLLGGTIEFALGNLQTAESHLNKVVRASPRNAHAIRMLAATQLRLGRPDGAAKTLAPVDMNRIEDAGILAVAGEIALAKKEFSKAITYFERATMLRPDNPSIRAELGVARMAQGDNRALADFQAAAGMDLSDTRADIVIILSQIKLGHFDGALTSITALEKKQPQSPLPWNYRGVAYLGKKDIENARTSFERALKIDPKFLPAANYLARLDVLEKKPEAARKRFESILAVDKNNAGAMLALSDLAAAAKQEKAYVDWLVKAMKADQKGFRARSNLVRFYLTKNDNQKALALARETANAHPDSLQAMNLLGSTQLATGDYTAAIATFSRTTQKAPQSADSYLNLALAQIAEKQQDKARESLKKAIRIKPGFLKAQSTLVQLELANKQLEAALQIVRQIQIQNPKSPIGFVQEGDIMLTQKSYSKAINAYKQALSKGSGSAGLMKLHRTYLMAGDIKAADQRLAIWMKQHPSDLAVQTYAAEAYMLTKHNREAIAQYEMLLKSNPNNVSTLNNLANLYHRENDNRAVSTAERALKLAPEHPSVLDTLGWILVEHGQLPRGLQYLSKATAKDAKSPSVRYHYGAALARSGNKAAARKELEAAIANGQRFPEWEDAKTLLKSL